jgi:hypothetical protein
MEQDNEDRRGFQVKDRRRFSETGEARSGVSEEPAPASSTAAEPPPAPHPSASEEPVTFSTFVLGLSTQALLHLGEIADPVSGAVERDLGAAKHVIDILAILGEKTRSNLEPDEQALLESMLYDLRMRYVEIVRRGTKEGK